MRVLAVLAVLAKHVLAVLAVVLAANTQGMEVLARVLANTKELRSVLAQ